MSERVFEVCVYDRPNEGKVMVSVEGSYRGDGCNYVIITPEEATLLKEFLISKGY